MRKVGTYLRGDSVLEFYDFRVATVRAIIDNSYDCECVVRGNPATYLACADERTVVVERVRHYRQVTSLPFIGPVAMIALPAM